ncbi:MAG: hypothetical protein HRT88_18065 [Lentisphaeraceae bacterium]|nr:hypothetical protein [Lentisphaeraceae bacterium]
MSIFLSSASNNGDLDKFIAHGVKAFVIQGQTLANDELQQICYSLRKEADRCNTAVSIIIQLSGHRPYLNSPQPKMMSVGDTLALIKKNETISPELTFANYTGNLPSSLYKEGMLLDIAGYPQALRVLAVKDQQLFCEVKKEFLLRSGLYLDYEIEGECVPAFSEADFDTIEKAVECKADYILLPPHRAAERFTKLSDILQQRSLPQKVLTYKGDQGLFSFIHNKDLNFNNIQKLNGSESTVIEGLSLQFLDNTAARREVQWFVQGGIANFCIDAHYPDILSKIKTVNDILAEENKSDLEKEALIDVVLPKAINMEVDHCVIITDSEECLSALAKSSVHTLLLTTNRRLFGVAAALANVEVCMISGEAVNAAAINSKVISRYQLNGKLLCLYNSKDARIQPDKLVIKDINR